MQDEFPDPTLKSRESRDVFPTLAVSRASCLYRLRNVALTIKHVDRQSGSGPTGEFCNYLGVTWIRAPGSESSSIHSDPSGPCSTSRRRWPTTHRSAVLAPPWPSKMMRLSVMVARPLMKPLPFHCGN